MLVNIPHHLSPYGWRAISLLTGGGLPPSLRVEGHLPLLTAGGISPSTTGGRLSPSTYGWRAISLYLRVEGYLSPYGWRTISLLMGGGPSLSVWVESHLSLLTGGGPSLSLRVEGHLSLLMGEGHLSLLTDGEPSLSLRVEGHLSSFGWRALWACATSDVAQECTYGTVPSDDARVIVLSPCCMMHVQLMTQESNVYVIFVCHVSVAVSQASFSGHNGMIRERAGDS